jgi:hypothetical protein
MTAAAILWTSCFMVVDVIGENGEIGNGVGDVRAAQTYATKRQCLRAAKESGHEFWCVKGDGGIGHTATFFLG